MRRAILIMLACLSLAAAGCEHGWGRRGDPDCIKPTVAVMKFDNRAPFPLGWKVGEGLAEVIVDRLLATGRYHVVERPEIDSVLREINFQQSGATRRQGRTATGRLKNVQYLIKGVVTDFGHVSSNRGFFNALHWDIFGGGSRAVMAITLQVVDVESGEIVTSESISGSVRARDVQVQATYQGLAFGGSTFARTPLGKATSKVVGKAVKRIGRTIAARPWRPKVAQVTADGRAIINGGVDRRVYLGTEYDVLAPGERVVDPDTGDVLGHRPGQRLGRVRVVQLYQRYSVAEMVDGELGDIRPGHHCRVVAAESRR